MRTRARRGRDERVPVLCKILGFGALLGAVLPFAGCGSVPFLGSDPSAPRDRRARFDRFADELLLELADTAPSLERIRLQGLASGALHPEGPAAPAALDETRREVVRMRLLNDARVRLEDDFAPARFDDPAYASYARMLQRDVRRQLDLDGDGLPLGPSESLAPPLLSSWSGLPFAAPSVLAREQPDATRADVERWKARMLRIADQLQLDAEAGAPLERWLAATAPSRAAAVVAALLEDLGRLRPALGTTSTSDPLFGPLAAALQALPDADAARRVRFDRSDRRRIGDAFDGFADRLVAARRSLAAETDAARVAPLEGTELRRWRAGLADAAGPDAEPQVLESLARGEIERLTLELGAVLEVDGDVEAVRARFGELRDRARLRSSPVPPRAPAALWEEIEAGLDALVAAPHPPHLVRAEVGRSFERPHGRWAPVVHGDLTPAEDPLARATVYLRPRERDPVANRLVREAEALRYGLPGVALLDAYRRTSPLPTVLRTEPREAFEEGWALYAIGEVDRLGVYAPSDGGLGWRIQELVAFGALLADVGLHARGWSMDQAVDTLVELTPLTRSGAREVVLRSIAEPARVALPAIGALRLRTLRRYVEEQLGPAFDAPTFHRALLSGGPVPLSEADRRVAGWLSGIESIDDATR